MGRREDPDRGLDPLDRNLLELQDSVRVLYMTDPLFHAQVHAGARVLERIQPGLDRREAVTAALLVLAAARTLPSPPPRPAAVLVGHGLAENTNGDPVCVCGWDPAIFPWPDGIVMSRENGRMLVRQHALNPQD